VRVGLVLGGGGVVGLAYHAAALTALETDLGWDPRSAEVIVGTSAGSVVGSLLRLGVPATDLAALAVDVETRATPRHIEIALRQQADFPDIALRSFLRLPRPPSPALLASWVRRPWHFDPVAAVVAVMADGRLDLAELASGADAIGDGWPEQPLWICAVRRHDLRRVVFGRDAFPPLTTAMAASCAIPGYFSPVDAGGQDYLDGGVRSPTNADVLRHRALDVAIIVSPMSGTGLPRFGLTAAMRRYAKRKVDAEVAVLRKAGVPAVVIEPSAEVAAHLGRDFMDRGHVGEAVRLGYLDAGEQLGRPSLRRLLAGLDRRARATEQREQQHAPT
jgi:NTE family protein